MLKALVRGLIFRTQPCAGKNLLPFLVILGVRGQSQALSYTYSLILWVCLKRLTAEHGTEVLLG